MAEDGSAAPPTTVGGGHAGDSGMHSANDGRGRSSGERLERIVTPLSPGATTPPNPFSRRHTSLDMDDYFVGPRDTQKHSKWPLFMQMHGSILPKLIMPLLFMGLWAALITSLHMAPYFKERNVKGQFLKTTPCGKKGLPKLEPTNTKNLQLSTK